MSVRAKFSVLEKIEQQPGDYTGTQFNITLVPVVGGSPENDSFYKYTPSGKIELSTINKKAADAFIVGQAYYVDFTPAD